MLYLTEVMSRVRVVVAVLFVVVLVVGLFPSESPAANRTLLGFVHMDDIEPGFAKNPPFGEIVREVRVEGNRHTRESVIKKAMKSRIGHPYTQENAQLDMLWVARLGSFTSVVFSTEPVSDGIALIITVTEATPYIPSLSMKITQENGFEIGPALSSMNLFGTAAWASVYARFGGATNIGIRYTDPQLPGRSLVWGHTVSYFHRERSNKLIGYNETSDEFFYEFKQTTSEDMRTGFRFRYMGLSSDKPGITLSSDDHDDIPSLGVFVQHDSRNAVLPTQGWFMDAELSKYGIFGADGDYWRFDMIAQRYLPVPGLGRRHSLALSMFGTLVSGELGETVPYHQEFYVGGTNSVRGWGLGARNGKNQWLNTAEYWYTLMDQKKWRVWFIKWRMGFQLGAFGDFGTAWSEPSRLEQNMIGGYGAGFRLTLPVITVVRFDFAYGEEGGSVQFLIGGAEKATAQRQRVR